MLVALTPSQISQNWKLFKREIERNLPPIGDWGQYNMNNILFNLMAGYAQLWTINTDDEDMRNLGFIVTTIYTDISGVKALVIYMVVVFDTLEDVSAESIYNTLKTFALNRGCSKICSYIMNKKLVDKLASYGAETRFTFVYKDI